MSISTSARPGIAMPDWACADHRIDPRALASGRIYEVGGRRFSLDRRGAVIDRDEALANAVPSRAFRGVAARAAEDAAGIVTVTLELMHDNPALCVPLLVANDLDNVAADWRDWSRFFSLPMLMVEADGSVSTMETEPRAPTRRPRPTGRPRFLARRRAGPMGVTLRIDGAEIIARR